MALTGGLETSGGDGVTAVAAAGASLLEREPAAIAHGGDALKKHSLLKAKDALAALRHVVRPPPAARAALLLLLGRIRREALPAFAPLGLLRACSCVVCCALFALICTRPHTIRGFIRPQAKKSREMNFPFYPRPAKAPEPQRRSGSVRPRSTAGSRPWVDPRSVVAIPPTSAKIQ